MESKANSINLRQPNRFTHEALLSKKQKDEEGQQQQSRNIKKQEQDQEEEHSMKELKTKPITKKSNLKNKKVINKKNQPSALRLQAINETFHKIQDNAEKMIEKFSIDRERFQDFVQYKNKVKCGGCGKSIKYYCMRCFYQNPELKFPKVQLPIGVTVIHHSSEKINKSSILPISFISEQIQKIQFNPNYQSHHQDSELKKIPSSSPGTYILYPHKNSTKLTKQMLPQIKNIVVLDCTWFQTDQLISILEKEKNCHNFIRLEQYESLYWRYNHHNDKALSSAEALIYFVREYLRLGGGEGEQYWKKFDDLMFLYCLNLKIVGDSYRRECAQGGGCDKEGIKQQKQAVRIEEEIEEESPEGIGEKKQDEENEEHN